VEQEAGKKNVDCRTDLDKTLTPATYRTGTENKDRGDSGDEPDAATVTTVKKTRPPRIQTKTVLVRESTF